MEYRLLGKTGLNVSRLSMGASALGGVFHEVEEQEAIRAVHAALDCGINFFDVAPAYGATCAETVLGKALRGIPRSRYYLSTKVGKYTSPEGYGKDLLDYSRTRIRDSLEESSARLGVEYFDIIHLHDIEYLNREQTERALDEGLEALNELKREGRIGGVSFGIYPLDLWRRILLSYEVDAGLVHNHFCLNDTGLLDLLSIAESKSVGIINGSPFASGLLTERGPAAWHPASAEDRAVFRRAAEFCQREWGFPITKLALQYSSQHPSIPTTLFSSSNAESIRRNVLWHEEPLDFAVVFKVQDILRPVINKQWAY